MQVDSVLVNSDYFHSLDLLIVWSAIYQISEVDWI